MKLISKRAIIIILTLIITVACWMPTIEFVDAQTQTVTNWEKLTEGWHIHTARYSSIKFFDSNNGLGLRYFTVEKTTDGGRNWKKVLSFKDIDTQSLVFTDNKNGWIVGSEKRPYKFKDTNDYLKNASQQNKPLILTTRDKGARWQKINVDESSLPAGDKRFSFFSDICFDKKGKSWLAGDRGIIEAGFVNKSLKVLEVFSAGERVTNITCDDAGDVWAIRNGDLVDSVLHYENGWKQIDLGNESFLKKDSDRVTAFKKIKVNGSEMWLVGVSASILIEPGENLDLRGVLLRSRDRGQTWENVTPASASGLTDINFNGDRGLLVGSKGSIYYTNDRGESWTQQASPTDKTLLNIFYLNPANIWISGDQGTILRYKR